MGEQKACVAVEAHLKKKKKAEKKETKRTTLERGMVNGFTTNPTSRLSEAYSALLSVL